MADIERSVEIEQIDYNVDINNVSYSIDILPQSTYTIELDKQGPQGLRGYTGNGIESYELTSTAGLIDTYTITFTDGETKTVDVTNGRDGVDGTSADITDVTATIDSNVGVPSVDVILGGTELSRTIEFDFHNLKGQPGQDGVDGVDGRDGEAATISIGTVTTGLPTDPASVTNVGTSSAAIFDFTIPKGEKGDTGEQGEQGIQGLTGNGVSGVSLLSTVGLVDTYRMSFTNGTYFDYPVKNGQDGVGGVSDVTVNGTSVLDGTTAKIDLTGYVTTNTAQTITARKTFTGEKAIYFKQVATTNKLGFTLYNPSDTELGAFEYRPNTISGGALLNVNVPYSSSNYVGFRYWGTAVNVIAPKVATAGNYFIPTHITDGNTTVTATSAGVINISSLLPSGGAVDSVNGQTGDVVLTASDVGALSDTTVIPTKTSDLTNDSGYISSIPSYYLQNNYTSSGNLAILGSISSGDSNTVVGSSGNIQGGDYNIVIGNSTIEKIGVNSTSDSIAIGKLANVNSLCNSSIAIGQGATCSAEQTIQLGSGTNNTAKSFSVGFINSGSPLNYQMLDGTTGLIPDSRISSNIARTSQIPDISNLADTDLSNLSATGQAVIDGQWVNYPETIAENVSLNGSTSLTYTLSGLPIDGNYEVLLSSVVNTGNVSGNAAQVNVTSDLITSAVSVCGTGTRANGVIQSRGSVILPVSSTRKIYVGRSTSYNGVFALYVRGYRRIGTNA